jgi:hypothetical protein
LATSASLRQQLGASAEALIASTARWVMAQVDACQSWYKFSESEGPMYLARCLDSLRAARKIVDSSLAKNIDATVSTGDKHLAVAVRSGIPSLKSLTAILEYVANAGLAPEHASLPAQIETGGKTMNTPSTNSSQSQGLPRWLTSTGFVVGILFLVAILGIVLWQPTPSPAQFLILRGTFALAGAAFSLSLMGFITVRMEIKKALVVTAGGTFAVFVILYFFAPASFDPASRTTEGRESARPTVAAPNAQ